MAFLLLTTGHVWEVAESYAQVKTAMGGAGQGTEFTVGGEPMFFRYTSILAAAGTYEQVNVIVLGVVPG